MYRSIARFMGNENAATAIEYGMIAFAIGLSIAVAMPIIGDEVLAMLTPVGIALGVI